MIKLFSFRAAFGEPSASPYCVKIMCLLNLAEEEWEIEYVDDPRSMPYKRLPVIEADSKMIADSQLIQEFLEERKGKEALWPGLSAAERGYAHALIRLAQDNLYYALVHERWINDHIWPMTNRSFFGKMPQPMKSILPRMLRRNMRNRLNGQGYGQLSPAHQLKQIQTDLGAINAALGENTFLFGEKPSAADAAILPLLSALMCLPDDNMLSKAVSENENLSKWVERGRNALYPEEVQVSR